MDLTALSKLAITRGTILCGHFDKIDHPKFFVIIGENEKQFVGFFFINSDIHQSIRNKQAQFEMQMQIRKTDYDFLNYDSFIGADKINIISKAKLASDIVNGKTQIKGNITFQDMSMLIDAVRESKIFSEIEKDTFFK